MLLFPITGTQLTFRARVLDDQNPSVVALIRKELPIETTSGHVVVSGQTFWLPTRILSLGSGNMVERKPGAVYYYAPGQTICVCYGTITESAKVNQFAEVLPEDFDKLQAAGELIYHQTVDNEEKKIVRFTIVAIGSEAEGEVHPAKALPSAANGTQPAWVPTKARIEEEIGKIWMEEPEELRRVRLGYVESGAGTGGQFFSILVHLEAYLMMDGADIIFRILKLSQETTWTICQIRNTTREFLTKTFNHFEFLSDLGISDMLTIGKIYNAALDKIESKDDFVDLTSSLLVYITRMHRWIHLIFPWHLGKQFRHRSLEEIAGVPKLVFYSEGSENGN